MLWQRPAFRRGIRMISVSCSPDFKNWTVQKIRLYSMALMWHDSRRVPKNVPLIGRADRYFWPWSSRHVDSDKTYEFLTRPACVKNVWRSGTTARPRVTENQKRVVKSESQDTYDLMTIFRDTSPILIERQTKSDPPPVPKHALIRRLDFNSH